MPFPPKRSYQAYNKLNRRVSAELLAVDVKSFLDKVSEPTEKDILATYEEGKNRFPIPTSPEPSFKQRKKIAFQYVLGKFEDFEQREVDQISPTITDEEIYRILRDQQRDIQDRGAARRRTRCRRQDGRHAGRCGCGSDPRSQITNRLTAEDEASQGRAGQRRAG